MTFICVFSVIIVDDVAYTLGCSPVSIYIFYFNYFWSRPPMVAAVWAGTPVYGAQGQWGSEGNWLIGPTASLKIVHLSKQKSWTPLT